MRNLIMRFEKFVEICSIVLKEKLVNSRTARDYNIDYNTFVEAIEKLEKIGFVKKTEKGWLLV